MDGFGSLCGMKIRHLIFNRVSGTVGFISAVISAYECIGRSFCQEAFSISSDSEKVGWVAFQDVLVPRNM